MREFLLKIHHKIVDIMADSWLVENILIAKVTENIDGTTEIYDCIYCTILRNAVIFCIIGVILGYGLATFSTHPCGV